MSISGQRTARQDEMTVIHEGDGLLDPAVVGHKFARLESLRRKGFPVPGLFCLSAGAFDQALDSLRPGLPALPDRRASPDATPDRDAVEAWCGTAAAALRDAPPSGHSATRLFDAFDRQIGDHGMAAVRACVVPGEDGVGEDAASDPFAGMSDSFLYVPKEGLLLAVARCWASAFKPEAVRYRLLKGIDPTSVRVAVGVQRMVLGTRSFVAFTREPRDAARRHVIAAAYGIGEGVVQEKADVDHFFVDPGTYRVRAETVVKRLMVGPPTVRAGDPVVVPVPGRLADTPVLTDEDAGRIAVLAEGVEDVFGCPQDIEGAITPDGTLHLVQARPMVADRTDRLPADDAGPRVYWGNHNLTESYPGISGALTYSQARTFYQLIFTDFYRRMGVSAGDLRANAHRLSRMVGYLDGRIYYRLDDWQILHGQMPVFDLVRTGWEEAMGISGEARLQRRWSWFRMAASLPAIARHAVGHPRATRQLLRWWDALMEEVYGVDQRSPEELVALYRRVWAEVSERWGITLANAIYGLIVMRVGTALLRRWADAGPELLVGLLCGGPENRSLAAARAAIALAEKAGEVPELRDALLETDAKGRTDEEHLRAVWRDLAEGRYGAGIARSAEEYLRRYGDRALHDLKLDEPTPRQRPWMMAGMLRPFVRQGTTVAGSRADEARTALEARRQLRASCPNPVRRAVLRAVLVMVRWCVRAREDTRFCRTQLFGISREVTWRLGGELAEAGLLDDPRDVVDLTVEEVLGAFDGTVPGSDLRGLVAVRRAERERQRHVPDLPVLLSTSAGLPLATALRTASPAGESRTAPDDSTTLRGLGSSGGRIRARAKIVLDPSVAPDSCRDRILIARETDPGWLFLMIAAAGLVVERGTLLSHTAITGRLLGVPTAVSVAGATSRIPDGAWIELDGSLGTVTVLAEPIPE